MTVTKDGRGPYPIRSVDRVCDILDVLANTSEGVSLSDITEATNLPKSSVFRYLSALENRNYVERGEEAGVYRLGLAFRPQHTRGIARLTELARPELERLRDEIDETTNLGILDGTKVVHSVVCESQQMMRLAAHVGDRGFVHATALGKAMAANLSEDHVRSIVKITGLPEVTSSTITSLPALMEELETVRQQGYAIDEKENQGEGRCVAVAIPNLSFPAALSVSAPATRFPVQQIPSVVRALQRVAEHVSQQMQS